MLLWIDAGTQRLPRLVGLTKALEMILVRQCRILMDRGYSALFKVATIFILLKFIDF